MFCRRMARLAVLFCIAFPASLWAQGSISDGGVTFEISSFNSNPYSVNLSGVGAAGDHLFGLGFFYRLDGDTQEFPLGTPDSETYVGNTATLSYTNLGNFGAEVEIELIEYQPGYASLQYCLEFTNPAGVAPLNVDAFFYIDPDLDGTISDDSAVGISATEIQVFDTVFMNLIGAGADAWQVTTFSTLRTALNDAALTDLDNTGLPFGPADFTGAFQWSGRAVASPGTGTFCAQTIFSPDGVTTTPEPIDIPVDARWALIALILSLAGFGLVAAGRRV